MIVVHMYSIRRIIKEMSSFQIFRAVILFLTQQDLKTQPIVVPLKDTELVQSFSNSGGSNKTDSSNSSNKEAEFLEHFDVVILDSTKILNLTARIRIDEYLELKREAEITLKSLDHPILDFFHTIFINKINFSTKFDAYLYIHLDSLNQTVPSSKINELANLLKVHTKQMADASAPTHERLCSVIYSLLSEAYGDRVALLSLSSIGANGKPLEEQEKIKGVLPEFIKVGMLLHASNWTRLVDKGPDADNKPLATKFRQFWGAKSEQRRFKDGTILEAVVWPSSDLVLGSIAKLVLHRTTPTFRPRVFLFVIR